MVPYLSANNKARNAMRDMPVRWGVIREALLMSKLAITLILVACALLSQQKLPFEWGEFPPPSRQVEILSFSSQLESLRHQFHKGLPYPRLFAT